MVGLILKVAVPAARAGQPGIGSSARTLALPAPAPAPRADLPAIVRMSIAEIDYVIGQDAPVTVKIAPARHPNTAKPATLKLYVDAGGLPPELVKKVRLGKVRKTVTKTIGAKLKHAGPFRVRSCIALVCVTSPLRKVDGSTAATPATYRLAIRGGYLRSTSEGRRTTGTTYCASHGRAEHGIRHLSASLGEESPATSDNVLTIHRDGTVEGRVVATAPATYDWDSLDGCTPDPNGPGVVACNGASHHDTGTQDLGFTFASKAGDPKSVELKWHLPIADAGFFDADDSVCNVQSISQYPGDADVTTVVPLEDLMKTAAGSVAFATAAGANWSADYEGKPASIDENWDEGIRVIRVS